MEKPIPVQFFLLFQLSIIKCNEPSTIFTKHSLYKIFIHQKGINGLK